MHGASAHEQPLQQASRCYQHTCYPSIYYASELFTFTYTTAAALTQSLLSVHTTATRCSCVVSGYDACACNACDLGMTTMTQHRPNTCESANQPNSGECLELRPPTCLHMNCGQVMHTMDVYESSAIITQWLPAQQTAVQGMAEMR